jgi:GNAT superfamily N-acetyltransferase
MKVVIRLGTVKDLKAVHQLVVELAVYEREPDAVSNTVEMMLEDGFGTNPIFGFLVAECDEEIKGASIYYYRYSTWKGKRMYLEDLIVTEQMRGKGLGKQLFEQMLTIAKSENCTGMMWQVLDWNQPAIDFYKKYETRFDEGWLNCNIDFD